MEIKICRVLRLLQASTLQDIAFNLKKYSKKKNNKGKNEGTTENIDRLGDVTM